MSRSNYSRGAGGKGKREDPVSSLYFFDRLPRAIRDAINDAPALFNVETIHRSYQKRGEAETLRLMENMVAPLRGDRP